MWKPELPTDPEDAGWFVTYSVAFFGVAFCAVVIIWKQDMPSLGDWGDYLGGIFAAIGFIWVVVAHLISQARIEEGQTETRNQMELNREQIALTQQIVSSLGRIAMSSQLQDATTLRDTLPVFAQTDSTGTSTGRNTTAIIPISWTLRFRNEGGGVKLLGVESRTQGVAVNSNKGDAFPNGAVLILQFTSKEPIRDYGQVICDVKFEDLLQRIGRAKVTLDTSTGISSVEIKPGAADSSDAKA